LVLQHPVIQVAQCGSVRFQVATIGCQQVAATPGLGILQIVQNGIASLQRVGRVVLRSFPRHGGGTMIVQDRAATDQTNRAPVIGVRFTLNVRF
jgi:hypothetical protein